MADLSGWLAAARGTCDMRTAEIPWARSREWVFDGGRLRHRGGSFFSVVGAGLRVGGARRDRYDQPLIDQPEIGILGFLVRRGPDGHEILVQAKPEPGNPGFVQAAPTVQATESNYRRRHGGDPTPYLSWFLPPGPVLASSLQSEQGTRFLGKYNRNAVVVAPDGAAVAGGPDHAWFPATEVAARLLADFEVNTDARSVLATGPWGLLAADGRPFERWRGRGGLGETLLRSLEAGEDRCLLPDAQAVARLARLRAAAEFETERVDLRSLSWWEVTDTAIRPLQGDAFTVRQFAVACARREVPRWDQPLVASAREGRAALHCRDHGGVLHFLFRARPEIGFRERLQLGPTVQEPGDGFLDLPSVRDEGPALLSTLHSEEGGRFFRCVNRYTIRLVEHDGPPDVVPLALGQVRRLIGRPGFFSNEARSLVSMMLAYA